MEKLNEYSPWLAALVAGGALATLSETLEARFQQPNFLWRAMRFLNVGQERRMRACLAMMHGAMNDIIVRNLERRSDPAYARRTKDVISLFMDEMDLDKTDAATGKQKIVQVPATKFVSFHAGPRICPGMRVGLFELKTALAYIVSKYRVKTVKPPEGFTYAVSAVLSVKGPLLVTVEDASARRY
ncbi:hypothetical protein PybrP1_003233 [[Pythium] brassicae (nom. inval.)]|nr:hypothetical protein PybrP1_003233 [[Pythium] brassicae (nom. inval.)]